MNTKNLKLKVEHSTSKSEWKIVNTVLGAKYKIATVPYVKCDDNEVTENNKKEALDHAEFIRDAFNNMRLFKNITNN